MAACCLGGCDKTTPALLMGADQHEHPCDLCSRRTDAAWQLARPDPGQRIGRHEILGRAPRRQHRSASLDADRRRHRALGRNLHDHGHGIHHDQPDRGAGFFPSRCELDSGGGFQSCQDGEPFWPAHRGNGMGGFETAGHFKRRFLQQRDCSRVRSGRLDQCRHSPGSAGRARGNQDHAGSLRSVVP